jgi:hypothetical protein
MINGLVYNEFRTPLAWRLAASSVLSTLDKVSRGEDVSGSKVTPRLHNLIASKIYCQKKWHRGGGVLPDSISNNKSIVVTGALKSLLKEKKIVDSNKTLLMLERASGKLALSQTLTKEESRLLKDFCWALQE